jgi:hypothetical protein
MVHYFTHRSFQMKETKSLSPFTLMLKKQFKGYPEDVVKETFFRFGIDPIQPFLEEHGIKSYHHVIFDEVICTDYNSNFIESIKTLKESVASLWIAMGSVPITGKNQIFS